MLRGFLFNLWHVACLYSHGFKTEMCRWVQCPGFVCVTQRYALLSLQPWGWGNTSAMGQGGWRMRPGCGRLSVSVFPMRRVLSLCPRLEWEGVHMLAECFPFAAGLSLLPCKRSDCFHRKAVFVERRVILRASASYFSSSLWPVLYCILPLPNASHVISHRWYLVTW